MPRAATGVVRKGFMLAAEIVMRDAASAVAQWFCSTGNDAARNEERPPIEAAYSFALWYSVSAFRNSRSIISHFLVPGLVFSSASRQAIIVSKAARCASFMAAPSFLTQWLVGAGRACVTSRGRTQKN